MYSMHIFMDMRGICRLRREIGDEEEEMIPKNFGNIRGKLYDKIGIWGD